PGGQFATYPPAGFGLQVDADAFLAAVDRKEIIAADVRNVGMEAIGYVHVAGRIPSAWLLDLDDLAAEVGQHHGAVGTRDAMGEVEDLHALEWTPAAVGTHTLTPISRDGSRTVAVPLQLRSPRWLVPDHSTSTVASPPSLALPVT